MFSGPGGIAIEDAPMVVVLASMMAVLLGAVLHGWSVGAKADASRHQERLHQAPRTASQLEAGRLVQLRYQRGEIDRPTYERELDEVRRRHAA